MRNKLSERQTETILTPTDKSEAIRVTKMYERQLEESRKEIEAWIKKLQELYPEHHNIE